MLSRYERLPVARNGRLVRVWPEHRVGLDPFAPSYQCIVAPADTGHWRVEHGPVPAWRARESAVRISDETHGPVLLAGHVWSQNWH